MFMRNITVNNKYCGLIKYKRTREIKNIGCGSNCENNYLIENQDLCPICSNPYNNNKIEIITWEKFFLFGLLPFYWFQEINENIL